MTFFRQAALLLPSAFLLGVLLFLLTHGHQDAGFGAYPFFEQWAGRRFVATSPEARFVEQSALFFAPAYLVTLLFVLFIALAESGLFGPRPKPARSAYRRAFGLAYAGLLLVSTGVLVVVGERAAARIAPGALMAPVLVAACPFGAAIVAFPLAALLAGPLALLKRAGTV
ncbi:MAG TPA: hypothetical protein VEO37_04430 [Thermoanaerobaculia bacterium]|nr:hypothetical protein [Thermoanaerobaculia bacterium]